MKAIQENKPLRALEALKALRVVMILVVLMMLMPLQAQVRIGQEKEPTMGAVLDLSSDNNTAGYIGGLKLPHVVITSLTVIPTGDATGFKEVPADKTTLAGTLVYNKTASTGIPVGIYFWDGAKWIKTKYEVKNGLSADATDPNIFKLGGALTEPTTISGLTATNKMAFTGTGVDAFKVDGTTLSVDANNHRVGIGTAIPTAKIHIDAGGTLSSPAMGFQLMDGTQGQGKILYSRNNGTAKWLGAAPNAFQIVKNQRMAVNVPAGGTLIKKDVVLSPIKPGLYKFEIQIGSGQYAGDEIIAEGPWMIDIDNGRYTSSGFKVVNPDQAINDKRTVRQIIMYLDEAIPTDVPVYISCSVKGPLNTTGISNSWVDVLVSAQILIYVTPDDTMFSNPYYDIWK